MVTLPRRRKLVQAIAMAISVPFISACGSGGGAADNSDAVEPDPIEPQPAPVPKFLVYPNAADPRILGGFMDGGEQAVLYGEKNADGKIMAVDEVNFIPLGSEETSTARFFAHEEKVVGIANGVQVELGKDADGGMIFGLIAGEKQLLLSLPAWVGGPAAKHKAQSGFPSSRLGKPAQLQLGTDACACAPAQQGKAAPKALAASAEYAPIATVNVSGCVGQNPIVKVIMRDETGAVLDTLFAKPDPTGAYNVSLPYLNSGDQAWAQAAQNALAFMEENFYLNENGFMLFEFLKDKLAGQVDDIPEGVIEHLESKGMDAEVYEEFAEFLNLSPGDIDKAHKRAKFLSFLGASMQVLFKTLDFFQKIELAYQAGLVMADFADAYIQSKFNQIQLQAVVETGNGQKFVGESSGLLAPEGPYPALFVAAPNLVSISSLALNPSNPSTGQNYIATGEVFCLEDGDTVVLSIVGTDGYTDSQSEAASGDPRQSFQLRVPGAQTGVRDTVTLQVLRQNTVVASRVASLVFG